MTSTSKVFLALASPEQAQMMRLLTSTELPLPVNTLSELLVRTPRDVRRLLRELKRAAMVSDRGGAVARTSALDVELSALWVDFESACCSGLSHTRVQPVVSRDAC